MAKPGLYSNIQAKRARIAAGSGERMREPGDKGAPSRGRLPWSRPRPPSRHHSQGDEVKSPAWQRSEGKNPEGGLNAKGRASAKAEGMNLKAPVKAGDNPRRASFLARMGNMPGPERKNGEPTRLLLSLQAWGASSKADAKAKAKGISARNGIIRKAMKD
jgi:hypothetical protein